MSAYDTVQWMVRLKRTKTISWALQFDRIAQ